METLMEKVSKREHTKGLLDTRGYMPRIYDVRAPCQWLDHCQDGKCPAFMKINGNFYCAKANQIHG